MAGINLLNQLRGRKKGKNREVSGVSSVSSVSQSSIRQTATNFFMRGDNTGDRRLFVRFLVMLGLFFGGYKGLEIYLQSELDLRQGELDKAQQALAKENKRKNELKGVQEEMQGYQARMQEITSKLKVVSSREGMRDYFVRILDFIATEMPREVWFSEITATRSPLDKDNLMNLKGYANSPQAVSELILKLDNSVYFPKSTLDRLESSTPGDLGKGQAVQQVPVNARKFSISTKLGE